MLTPLCENVLLFLFPLRCLLAGDALNNRFSLLKVPVLGFQQFQSRFKAYKIALLDVLAKNGITP